ncbi:hypothetical protein LZ32DRAFT_421708 [Colletotrichum eremochloae]|nr:hypothetical protein LZ32DRAFT_421708 [Colletotrichum eremochloae]
MQTPFNCLGWLPPLPSVITSLPPERPTLTRHRSKEVGFAGWPTSVSLWLCLCLKAASRSLHSHPLSTTHPKRCWLFVHARLCVAIFDFRSLSRVIFTGRPPGPSQVPHNRDHIHTHTPKPPQAHVQHALSPNKQTLDNLLNEATFPLSANPSGFFVAASLQKLGGRGIAGQLFQIKYLPGTDELHIVMYLPKDYGLPRSGLATAASARPYHHSLALPWCFLLLTRTPRHLLALSPIVTWQ